MRLQRVNGGLTMEKTTNEELVNLIISLLHIIQNTECGSTDELKRIYNFVNNRFIGRGR